MLIVDDLHVSYKQNQSFSFRTKRLNVLEGIYLQINPSEILGLVGESGCGKSTLGKAILSLLEIDRGRITLDGKDLSKLDRHEAKQFRRKIQVVFQDPYSSLNPRLTIEEIVSEGLQIHEPKLSKDETKKRIIDALADVNLSSDILSRYPHEFSGGQRQRIAIARALVLDPEILVCDEAVSALDISTQAQVINNLMDLREKRGISILFISHDLRLVKHISDRIAVMYLGQIVEEGNKREISENPKHPYTKALFDSGFDFKKRGKPLFALQGEIPSLFTPIPGCRFSSRCPKKQTICESTKPTLEMYENQRKVRCFFPLYD